MHYDRGAVDAIKRLAENLRARASRETIPGHPNRFTRLGVEASQLATTADRLAYDLGAFIRADEAEARHREQKDLRPSRK